MVELIEVLTLNQVQQGETSSVFRGVMEFWWIQDNLSRGTYFYWKNRVCSLLDDAYYVIRVVDR